MLLQRPSLVVAPPCCVPMRLPDPPKELVHQLLISVALCRGNAESRDAPHHAAHRTVAPHRNAPRSRMSSPPSLDHSSSSTGGGGMSGSKISISSSGGGRGGQSKQQQQQRGRNKPQPQQQRMTGPVSVALLAPDSIGSCSSSGGELTLGAHCDVAPACGPRVLPPPAALGSSVATLAAPPPPPPLLPRCCSPLRDSSCDRLTPQRPMRVRCSRCWTTAALERNRRVL